MCRIRFLWNAACPFWHNQPMVSTFERSVLLDRDNYYGLFVAWMALGNLYIAWLAQGFKMGFDSTIGSEFSFNFNVCGHPKVGN